MTTIPEGFRGEYATRKELQEDFTVKIGEKEETTKKGTKIETQAFIDVDATFVNVWLKGPGLVPQPAKMDIQNVVHNEPQKTVDFHVVLPDTSTAAVQLSNPAPGRYLIHVPFAPLKYLILAMFAEIEEKQLAETREDVLEENPDATEDEVKRRFAIFQKVTHADDTKKVLLGLAALNFTLGERFTKDTTVPETTDDGPLIGKWDLVPKDGDGGGVLPLAVGGGAALMLLLMVK